MKHLFFIDSLNKLTIAKDSSLMLALSLQQRGVDVFLLFEEDFSIVNDMKLRLKVHSFNGTLNPDLFSIDDFTLEAEQEIELNSSDMIHMRLDPPFDSRYMRYLWMLKFITDNKIAQVVNHPDGIILHNEKLYAYAAPEALPSYIGRDEKQFKLFCKKLEKQGSKAIILKPFNLYQGIGVEKVEMDDSILEEAFLRKVKEFNGPVIAQAFDERIYQGEIRAIFFNEKEIGSILKIPEKGGYLANIVQGASYQAYTLSSKQQTECQRICKELKSFGVLWAAFDLIGDTVSEVNITCPGLLVEAARAHKRNLADEISFL